MILHRFEVPGLAHYSYLVASKGVAAVVDPKRDIDTYLEFAAAHEMKITHVLETHIHADYASGALELAIATDAVLWLSGHDEDEDCQYQFSHHEFRDGEVLELGDVRIKALHTPGHTPEHLSFVVSDLARGDYPLALLSGDFVFVGSLGRPDLLGEAAKQRLAGELFDSVHKRLAGLPDGVEVHPAHGAGSLCGAGMSDRQQTTLGCERALNGYFGQKDKAKFVHEILTSVPPFPEYYRRMKKINSEGPPLLGKQIEGPSAIPVHEFNALASTRDFTILDLRRPEAFGGAHLRNSMNIGAGQNLSLWAGWMMVPDRPILLVGELGIDYGQAWRSLLRVGLDKVQGYLKGGVAGWIDSGLALARVEQISVLELKERAGKGAAVLDVRSNAEWKQGHILGAEHRTLGDLPKHLDGLPSARPIHVICGSGYRSSIAASLLQSAGFTGVVNAVGGMAAWHAQHLAVASGPASSR